MIPKSSASAVSFNIAGRIDNNIPKVVNVAGNGIYNLKFMMIMYLLKYLYYYLIYYLYGKSAINIFFHSCIDQRVVVKKWG